MMSYHDILSILLHNVFLYHYKLKYREEINIYWFCDFVYLWFAATFTTHDFRRYKISVLINTKSKYNFSDRHIWESNWNSIEMMVFKPINIDINYSFPLNDKMMLDYGDALIYSPSFLLMNILKSVSGNLCMII